MLIKNIDEREKKMYLAFADELTDADEAPPNVACKDAKYFLELQRKKLQSYGMDVKYRLKSAGVLTNIAGSRFEGLKYTGDRLFRGYDCKEDFYLNGKKIRTHRERLVLYQMLISAKTGVDAKDTYACPSCGAISTFEQLEKGCPYCKSHFMMSELFPKVTQYFWLHDYSMSPYEFGIRALKWAVGGLTAGLIVGLLTMGRMPLYGVIWLISCMIFGIFAGGILSLFAIIIKLISDSLKAAPLMAKTAGDKKRTEEFMKKYDPYFFYELFESRVLSLLSVMLYGEDFTEQAMYCGKNPVGPSDVVDMKFRGAVDVEKVEAQGDFMYITLTVFTTCLHIKGKRLVRQNDEYRMIVTRHIRAVSDPGFTIRKVDCISCGGSFNALREKACPYCHREFRLYDYDWVVYDFQK